VIGLDGERKMSKSFDNEIVLAATPEETAKRVATAFTDPSRRYRTDPGHPEICNVFTLHKYFNQERAEEIAAQSRGAEIGCVDCKKILADGINRGLAPFREREIGCVDCKKILADGINRGLAPFRERRAEIAERPGYIEEVLADGAERAQALARDTIAEVKDKMGLP